MQRLFVIGSCVMGLLVASPETALAAKKSPAQKKAEVEAKAPEVKEEKAEAPNSEPHFIGYGARGGATFGGRSGGRALFFGGTHFFNDGYGFLGLEVAYTHAFNPNVEMSFGLRFYGWPTRIAAGVNAGYGFAPLVEAKYRFFESGSFHLAGTIGGLFAMTPVGMFGGMTIGITIDPGIAASYFFADNMELYLTFNMPVTPLFLPVPLVQIGFQPRLGFAYTLKPSGVGFFAAVDISPGFFAYGGFPSIENNLATPVVKPTFRVAVNTNLGVQYRF